MGGATTGGGAMTVVLLITVVLTRFILHIHMCLQSRMYVCVERNMYVNIHQWPSYTIKSDSISLYITSLHHHLHENLIGFIFWFDHSQSSHQSCCCCWPQEHVEVAYFAQHWQCHQCDHRNGRPVLPGQHMCVDFHSLSRGWSSHLLTGNPNTGKPYYWADDHPLLYMEIMGV